MKALFVIIDVLFAVAEGVASLMEKRKAKRPPPPSLSLRDIMEMKRADAELVKRTQAPTVVIPPPSERERPKRR
jgi:hypothetical protein